MTREKYLEMHSSLVEEYGQKSREVVALQWREAFILRVLFLLFMDAARQSTTGMWEVTEEELANKFDDEVKFNPYFRGLAEKVQSILNKTSVK